MGLVERVSGLGFDAIEICLSDPPSVSPARLAQRARECGLAVSVCASLGAANDVSHSDASRRQRGTAFLRSCVDVAAVVGSPHVAGPLYARAARPRWRPPVQRVDALARAAEILAGVAEYASTVGVALALEPLNRFETDLVNTVRDGTELCALIGAPNVGLLADTFHLNIEESSITDALTSAGPVLRHVHASENDRSAPGHGHIDWGAVIGTLEDVGYRGQLAIESFAPAPAAVAQAGAVWRPLARTQDELALAGLRFLRKELARRR